MRLTSQFLGRREQKDGSGHIFRLFCSRQLQIRLSGHKNRLFCVRESESKERTDESGAILSRSRQVLRRQAEDAGCEDGLSPDSFPSATGQPRGTFAAKRPQRPVQVQRCNANRTNIEIYAEPLQQTGHRDPSRCKGSNRRNDTRRRRKVPTAGASPDNHHRQTTWRKKKAKQESQG